jgi:hypothetical protein
MVACIEGVFDEKTIAHLVDLTGRKVTSTATRGWIRNLQAIPEIRGLAEGSVLRPFI